MAGTFKNNRNAPVIITPAHATITTKAIFFSLLIFINF